MIGLLTGKVLAKGATSLTIDCNGIGFLVNVPFPYAKSVEVKSMVTIHIQTVFARDSMELYGFSSEHEKEVFNIITSVRGIGARAGINILSRLSPEEISKAINENRIELFRTIPGIGPKKAEMIVFNLRKSAEETLSVPDTHKEIIQALRILGLTQKEVMQKLAEITDWEKKSVTDVIQAVLKKGK
jgi:Holliday junction DNA helicase RuvA